MRTYTTYIPLSPYASYHDVPYIVSVDFPVSGLPQERIQTIFPEIGSVIYWLFSIYGSSGNEKIHVNF